MTSFCNVRTHRDCLSIVHSFHKTRERERERERELEKEKEGRRIDYERESRSSDSRLLPVSS